uniref:Uncharacterized protein n=1 Tax=Cyclophora tenuis TaxID=216820 RepID=A0A7S1D4W0_CYCTE
MDEEEEGFDLFSRRRGNQRRRRRNRSDWNDDDFDDDWDDLEETFRGQATKLKDALTPRSEELEFYPTPDQLWKAITEYDRYKVPQTLLVQFEDDEMDQSSRLASALKDSSDIKFARLRGYHLTPVSVETEQPSNNNDGWLEISSKASRLIFKALQGKAARKRSAVSLRDLRLSVVRYIMDVATK